MRAAYDFSIKHMPTPCWQAAAPRRGQIPSPIPLGDANKGLSWWQRGFGDDTTNQLLFVAGVCNAYLLIKCRMCVKSSYYPLPPPLKGPPLCRRPACGAILAVLKWNQWIVMQR